MVYVDDDHYCINNNITGKLGALCQSRGGCTMQVL